MLYDNNGRLLVRAIFYELSTPERRANIPPVYTLKVESSQGLPSAYQIYMNSTDEYEAAQKLVGNMKAWRALCKATWFMNGFSEHGHEGLHQWRKDMEARDKSLAKVQLLEKAEGGNVAAMTKLYNMTPKKPDSRLRQKLPSTTPSKVVDLTERMKGK